jgi:hypothetical protein
MEKWANDHPSDSDPESLEGYDYLVQFPSVTIGQIWDCCGNSDDGKALKDICLSFGLACAEARHPKTRHFVLKKLLPSEQEYERAFRVIDERAFSEHQISNTKTANSRLAISLSNIVRSQDNLHFWSWSVCFQKITGP